MDNNLIANLVAEVAHNRHAKDGAAKPSPAPQAAPAPKAVAPKATPSPQAAPAPAAASAGGFTTADYPIMDKHQEIVKTPTGKHVSEITLEAVKNGSINQQDIRISREMLLNQAQIAESAGKVQMGQNLRRAAELTAVPDDVVIQMYDMIRPNRATKQQLVEMSNTLRTQYKAELCAKLVSEAAEVYEKRGILLK